MQRSLSPSGFACCEQLVSREEKPALGWQGTVETGENYLFGSTLDPVGAGIHFEQQGSEGFVFHVVPSLCHSGRPDINTCAPGRRGYDGQIISFSFQFLSGGKQ